MNDNVTTSSIARCLTCKRIIFAVADEPALLRHAAKDILGLITAGHAIEHVDHNIVRAEFGCHCPRPTQPALFNMGAC